jgi:hypothetical protein
MTIPIQRQRSGKSLRCTALIDFKDTVVLCVGAGQGQLLGG